MSYSSPPPRKFGAGLIFGIVVVLIAVTCGVAVYFGVLHKNNRGAGTAAAVAGLFGDLATLDPCSLVTADAFAGDGTEVHIQPGALHMCLVDLEFNDVGGGYQIYVDPGSRVVDPNHVDSSYRVSTVGSLHIAKEKLESGTSGICRRLVYDDNGTGVSIEPELLGATADGSGNPEPGYDSCAVGDQAVAAVVAAVQSHSVGRIRYPHDSLGSIDLCGTVTAADVNSAVGSTDVQLDTFGVAPESCPFQTPTSPHLPRTLVDASLFTTQDWLEKSSSGTSVTLAGRTTVYFGHTDDTFANDETTSCYAWSAQKTWTSWPGRQVFGGDLSAQRLGDSATSGTAPGLVEVAEISVILPHNTPVVTCRAAVQQLATEIWPKLPPPTA